jgi:hypothetical protein
MAVYSGGPKYIPGAYPQIRPDAGEPANRFIRAWEGKRLLSKAITRDITARFLTKVEKEYGREMESAAEVSRDPWIR